MREITPAIFVSDVAELENISTEKGLTLGANVTYSQALKHLSHYHPSFEGLIQRIGGAQIRNTGTIGGNIANGSPIGDMPPALIALNASLKLRSIEGVRFLPLEAFFLELWPARFAEREFVRSVSLPPLLASQRLNSIKSPNAVMKTFQHLWQL